MKVGLFLEKYRPHRNGAINSVELFRKEAENFGHKVYIFTSYEPDYLDSPNVFRFGSFRYSSFSDFRCSGIIKSIPGEQIKVYLSGGN